MSATPKGTTSGQQRKSHPLSGVGGRPEPVLLWIPTAQASIQLGISRKTLFRLKKQGILKQQHHWSRKNPASRCSDLLWHIQRCQLALGRF